MFTWAISTVFVAFWKTFVVIVYFGIVYNAQKNVKEKT